MNFFRLFLITVFVTTLNACASSVYTDYETQYDFSHFSSFTWADKPQANENDYLNFGGDIFENRLKRSVDKALSLKGMEQADNTGDFVISYALQTQEREVVRRDIDFNHYYLHNHHRYHSLFYFNEPYHHRNRSTERVRYYTVGTLTINIKDTKTGRVVWSSSADKILKKGIKPETAESKLDELAIEMFSEFPPNNVITL